MPSRMTTGDPKGIFDLEGKIPSKARVQTKITDEGGAATWRPPRHKPASGLFRNDTGSATFAVISFPPDRTAALLELHAVDISIEPDPPFLAEFALLDPPAPLISRGPEKKGKRAR